MQRGQPLTGVKLAVVTGTQLRLSGLALCKLRGSVTDKLKRRESYRADRHPGQDSSWLPTGRVLPPNSRMTEFPPDSTVSSLFSRGLEPSCCHGDRMPSEPSRELGTQRRKRADLRGRRAPGGCLHGAELWSLPLPRTPRPFLPASFLSIHIVDNLEAES